MEAYADKFAIFGLLEQLSDAANLGDVEAVKFLRESLISCSTGDNKALCDAIHEVFYVSGMWMRGMLDENSPKPMIRDAVERALDVMQSHEAAA